MSSLNSSLLKVNNKLIIGLRVKKEFNAWDMIKILNGLRITVIKDEVGLLILHAPAHVPLFAGIYKNRVMQLLNRWADYIEPLPSGITLSIIDNASIMFSGVKGRVTSVQGSTPVIMTICKLNNDQVRYTLFLRGATRGKADVLSCGDKASLLQLQDNIDLTLKPSPRPGSMFMTRYYPIDVDLTRHLMILGATGSGKTTLVKSLINSALQKNVFNKIVIFDPTGEYSLDLVGGRGYVAVPGIDIAVNPLALPRHKASELLSMAIQATALIYGENDNGGFSFIQLEILDKALERLGDRNTLKDLYVVLNDLEQELRRNDYLNAISAVRRRLRKVMIAALMRNALSASAAQSRLLVINMAPLYFVSQVAAIIFTLTFLEVLSGILRKSLVVIDEAHRILNRYMVGESIIERLIRG